MLISRYPRNSIAQLLSLNGYHLHNYRADSIKVALGIGNWAQGSYCLVVTRGIMTLFRMPKRPTANSQCLKQPLLNQLYIA